MRTVPARSPLASGGVPRTFFSLFSPTCVDLHRYYDHFFQNITHSPLSVPQSALWPNALMIRPYSTPARGLLGAPWQDSALSPGIFRKQWAPWEAANGENPGPGCAQLGSGTVELLNWRKIALYPGPLCLHSSLSSVINARAPQTQRCSR